MVQVGAVAVIAGDVNVKGSLQFTQDSAGFTHVKGRISGLKPGLHGFHVHALGDTTNGCISTGPHFNPSKKEHGAPTDSERHAGDLGNVLAGPDGVAEISIRDSQIPLSGKHSILGRAVVVHADPDDLGRGTTFLNLACQNKVPSLESTSREFLVENWHGHSVGTLLKHSIYSSKRVKMHNAHAAAT